MKNKQIFASILLISSFASASAIAAEKTYDERWYVAPSVSYIWTDSDRLSSHNDIGGSLGVGKALNEDFNLELKGFYNRFSHLESDNAGGPDRNQWDALGATADLQYYFNRNDLSPYAVLGLGAMDSEVHGKHAVGVVGEAGLGLAYKLNDYLSIRSDVRYRYNDNFNRELVSNGASTYNEMIVNVGVVIPFGSATKAEPTQAKAPIAESQVFEDSDNDGVRNAVDKCPNTNAGAKVNKAGCEIIITLKGVNFNVGSAVLTINAKAILDDLATDLKGLTTKKSIEVQGHSSSEGGKKFNMDLSSNRAQAVADYLASKGVSNKITAVGYGSTMPIADNATKEGRIENRRVDIVWN